MIKKILNKIPYQHQRVVLKCDLCNVKEWETTLQRANHYSRHRCRSCISKEVCSRPEVKKSQGSTKGMKRPDHSKRMSGKNNPMFGKAPEWYMDIYKGIKMRSSWEVKFAKWLDKGGHSWEYEPRAFSLSNGTNYIPDFFIKSTNEWVEIKGWERAEALQKSNLFKSEYPDLNYVKLYKEDLERLGVL